jgi:hypothetical protein
VIERLDMQSAGMEFASEMVVKATLHGLKIAEVPTTLARWAQPSAPFAQLARRLAPSAFSADHSPRWLFLYPPCDDFAGSWSSRGCCRGINGGIARHPYTRVRVGLVMLGLQACLFSIFTKCSG